MLQLRGTRLSFLSPNFELESKVGHTEELDPRTQIYCTFQNNSLLLPQESFLCRLPGLRKLAELQLNVKSICFTSTSISFFTEVSSTNFQSQEAEIL